MHDFMTSIGKDEKYKNTQQMNTHILHWIWRNKCFLPCFLLKLSYVLYNNPLQIKIHVPQLVTKWYDVLIMWICCIMLTSYMDRINCFIFYHVLFQNTTSLWNVVVGMYNIRNIFNLKCAQILHLGLLHEPWNASIWKMYIFSKQLYFFVCLFLFCIQHTVFVAY